MAWTVLEAKAAATAEGTTDRVYPSVEAAISDFESTEAPSSIDQVDVERLGRNRVVITIIYTA